MYLCRCCVRSLVPSVSVFLSTCMSFVCCAFNSFVGSFFLSFLSSFVQFFLSPFSYSFRSCIIAFFLYVCCSFVRSFLPSFVRYYSSLRSFFFSLSISVVPSFCRSLILHFRVHVCLYVCISVFTLLFMSLLLYACFVISFCMSLTMFLYLFCVCVFPSLSSLFPSFLLFFFRYYVITFLLLLCIYFLLFLVGLEKSSTSSFLSFEEVCGAAAWSIGKSLSAECQLCRRQPLERAAQQREGLDETSTKGAGGTTGLFLHNSVLPAFSKSSTSTGLASLALQLGCLRSLCQFGASALQVHLLELTVLCIRCLCLAAFFSSFSAPDDGDEGERVLLATVTEQKPLQKGINPQSTTTCVRNTLPARCNESSPSRAWLPHVADCFPCIARKPSLQSL